MLIRAQFNVPGLSSIYGGVSKDKMFYEPAEKELLPENICSTENYLNHVPKPKLFKKLRDTSMVMILISSIIVMIV